ncbi:unnamed protein product, partial [Ceratitis capitata]
CPFITEMLSSSSTRSPSYTRLEGGLTWEQQRDNWFRQGIPFRCYIDFLKSVTKSLAASAC